MEKLQLAYGTGTEEFVLPAGIVPRVVKPTAHPGLADPLAEVHRALREPIGTAPLATLLRERKPKNVVIVVNDVTRPTPYGILFPPLLEAFAEAGVRDDQVMLLVATGIHDAHSDRQNREVYGTEMVERFAVVCHDANDGNELVSLGVLASGNELWVNRLAVEADFLITIGVVTPHYFAGFSGGRKSILPGLAGRETVKRNHARMVELLDGLPAIDDNPVSLEMIDAARRVRVDFILNVVPDAGDKPVAVVAGDLEQAWRRAVTISSGLFEIPLAEAADVCVVSAGGYPRDINAYQAQKALDHADHATKPGGTIILAAECREGFGETVFMEWMRKGWPPERIIDEIRERFVMGGHKAYGFARVAAAKSLYLISALDRDDTKALFAEKFGSVRDAVDSAAGKHGPTASWIVMPEGGVSSPRVGAR